MSLKPIVSSTRILFSLLPGLGAMIVLRMAIHLYRPDIEDLNHRVRDHPYDQLYDCYDFIVVGGGSAGAVVASRLSEESNWTVLLLEAGPDENVLSEVPVLFPVLQSSSIDWQFLTEPSESSCLSMIENRCKWPRGKVLGGSSVLNAMLYIRGNRRDYDYWESMGNVGWSWADVLPYFLKSEDIRIPEYQGDKYHSVGGPLSVEYFNYEQPITRKIIEAGQQLGYLLVDLNGESQTGFSRSHATVRDGLRCSTAKAFLRPAATRDNLHVSVLSLVEKVVIDEHKRAYGVQFRKHGQERIIKANKEVILSAGALQTPQLLMLSGIGDAQHLKEIGISPIANLPGVGRNLQDHVAMGGHSYLFDNPYKNDTDYCFNLRSVFSVGNLIDFVINKKGSLYSMMEAEAMAFVKTKYADPNDDYPDIQLFIAPTADNMDGGLFGKRANGLTDETYAELYEDILYEPSFSIVPLLLRPKSRGYLKLRDDNPFSPPRIYANYYTHPDDVKVMIEGARIVHAITEQPALRELNARPNPSRNPGCTEHDLMSDEHLECQARHHSLTIYHPIGTCAMGPDTDPNAVVDPRLRVYGINNLRVVDASIMPVIVNGNTNAPTIMIGEKASDMIKEDWKDTEDMKHDNVCPRDLYRRSDKQLKSSSNKDETDRILSESNLINETSNIFTNLSPNIHNLVEQTKAKLDTNESNHVQNTTVKYIHPETAKPNKDRQSNLANEIYSSIKGPVPRKLPPNMANYYETQEQEYTHNIKPGYIIQPAVHIWPNLPHYKTIYTTSNSRTPTYQKPYYDKRNFRRPMKPRSFHQKPKQNDAYYEVNDIITPQGQRQCRIWLYYNGNKYEAFL